MLGDVTRLYAVTHIHIFSYYLRTPSCANILESVVVLKISHSRGVAIDDNTLSLLV